MGENTANEPIVSNIYDGAGNEVKVVTTEDSEGRRVQPTGETPEDAMKDRDSDDQVGHGFGN